MMKKKKVAKHYRQLQKEICLMLQETDGKGEFMTDKWESKLGEGASMVFTNGNAIEKAAVNFSKVSAPVTKNMRKSLKIEDGDLFFATGISSIIHPKNPHVPITHMNVRYFKLDNGLSWFGGGIDLTPHYVNIDEASLFHKQLEKICNNYEEGSYEKFKKWADNYFYLPHRNETRGVGGIFFDHLIPEDEFHFNKLFAFTHNLAIAYPEIYIDLMNKNRDKPFTKEEKAWQYLRRGRYVEFNLVYDRGTRFGLDSGGRTESIFLSMPPMASWEYMHEPEEGSNEWKTLQLLKKDIDWLGIKDELVIEPH